MLAELADSQQSNESIYTMRMSFEIETRSDTGDELIHRTYTFSYTEEWQKWMFHEFHEERTPNTGGISDRQWRQSRHIMWNDVAETPSVEVPPEVANQLQDATGAESIVMQIPTGGIDDTTYKEVYRTDE